MEINICENYRMTTTTLNYVLEKRMPERKDEKGEIIPESWATDGYFSNIKSLLRSYFNKQILKCDSRSIEELIETINKVETTIENFKVGI